MCRSHPPVRIPPRHKLRESCLPREIPRWVRRRIRAILLLSSGRRTHQGLPDYCSRAFLCNGTDPRSTNSVPLQLKGAFPTIVLKVRSIPNTDSFLVRTWWLLQIGQPHTGSASYFSLRCSILGVSREMSNKKQLLDKVPLWWVGRDLARGESPGGLGGIGGLSLSP